MSTWFGSYFHYGVCYRTSYNTGNRMILFEHLKDAMREAKFSLLNSADGVKVYSLGPNGMAKEIYRTTIKRTLIKVKE